MYHATVKPITPTVTNLSQNLVENIRICYKINSYDGGANCPVDDCSAWTEAEQRHKCCVSASRLPESHKFVKNRAQFVKPPLFARRFGYNGVQVSTSCGRGACTLFVVATKKKEESVWQKGWTKDAWEQGTFSLAG